jgi:hypothetical protein
MLSTLFIQKQIFGVKRILIHRHHGSKSLIQYFYLIYDASQLSELQNCKQFQFILVSADWSKLRSFVLAQTAERRTKKIRIILRL